MYFVFGTFYLNKSRCGQMADHKCRFINRARMLSSTLHIITGVVGASRNRIRQQQARLESCHIQCTRRDSLYIILYLLVYYYNRETENSASSLHRYNIELTYVSVVAICCFCSIPLDVLTYSFCR